MANAARDLARLGASIAAAPLRLAAETLHGLATGSVSVLELRVGHKRLGLIERHELLHRLRRAGDDDRVVAVLVHLDAPPGGWAATQDLAEAFRALSERGTRVYALLESASNATLYLAAACDHVFLVPTGEVAAVGAGLELTFFGGLLDRLGIRPDFEAAGAYKSFGEPFTRTYASAANREAMRAIVDDLHGQLLDGIADRRGLAREVVHRVFAEAPLGAEQALEAGLVDALAYEDEIHDWLDARHGESHRLSAFSAWARRDDVLQRLEEAGMDGASVAVVHLEGPVIHGERPRAAAVRARTVVPLLRALHDNDEVAAVVLHVSSPGGSALASDLIWREARRLAEYKVLVACFEDVAASGGYYFAAPAREIVARPGTLTGSIGVFGGKLVLGEGMRELGITTEAVVATDSGAMYSASQPFTEAQRKRFRASLQRVYDGFVERVAEGRGAEADAIEIHCRGRVWTGRAALERGLVDRYGSLLSAVHRAQSLASVRRGSRVVHIDGRPRQPLWMRISSALTPSAPAALAAWLGLAPAARALLDRPGEAFALMPWNFRIRGQAGSWWIW